MKNVETERKFLVRDDSYKSQAVKSFRIKQGYISHDGGNTVRVRIRDNQGFLTIKGPSYDGISRFEWEKEIPLEDAEALCTLCKGGFIDKTR
ncbi:MAG: CYTH domain-containing protein, partial [Bacteroidales bacterium]|nr:CYTH domain-containing protein [Bacteroidales bacterium]